MPNHTVLESPEKVVTIGYINYRGEVSIRQIIPYEFGWGNNDYYTKPQFLLDAYDLGKRANRTFALTNILFWRTANVKQNEIESVESSSITTEALCSLFSDRNTAK